MNPNEATLVWVDEYSRMAEAYDRIVVPRFEPIARMTVEVARPKPNEAVLDVGTGTGLLACLLAPLVAPQSVVAIDLADEALAVASHRAGNAGLRNIRFEMMDARNIVYRGGIFDAVVSNLGIPNLGYDRTFLEARRLLRAGGRFVFSEWDAKLPEGFAAFRQLIEKHGTPSPSRSLAQVREARALVRSDPDANALVNPREVTERLHDLGFARVEVVSRTFTARFADVREFIAFEAAWGWNERELQEMSPDARDAFEGELADRLSKGRDAPGLEETWPIHFYFARPE